MPHNTMQELTKARLKRLEKNLDHMADIISRDGEKFWGIYEKLEAERKSLKRRRKRLKLRGLNKLNEQRLP